MEKISDIDLHYGCQALKSIPSTTLRKVIETMIKESGSKQWISIGSGNGILEGWIRDQFGINVITVDPKPINNAYCPMDSFTASKFRLNENHFEKTEELIEKHSEYIGNCILLLIWSNPNDSSFDYDAIQLLKPNFILPLIETSSGIAGSEIFHSFFRTKCVNDEKLSQELYKHSGIWDLLTIDKSVNIDDITYHWFYGIIHHGIDGANIPMTLSFSILSKEKPLVSTFDVGKDVFFPEIDKCLIC
jgi:hypothetical protein